MQLNFFKQQKNRKLFLDNQLMSFNLGKKKLNVVNTYILIGEHYDNTKINIRRC